MALGGGLLTPRKGLRTGLLLLLWAKIAVQPVPADLAEGLAAAARSDWSRALREFEGPALRGNSNAQVNLGTLYLNGFGVAQNDATAYLWFERAALQGNAIAESKLGVLLYQGIGTPVNRAKAAEWFQKAADQGDAHAARVLGDMYSVGDGVPQNPTDAYLWLTIAEELGHLEAKEPRDELAETLSAQDLRRALERVDRWRERYQQHLASAERKGRHGPMEKAQNSVPEAVKNSDDSPPAKGPNQPRSHSPGSKKTRRKPAPGLRPEAVPKG